MECKVAVNVSRVTRFQQEKNVFSNTQMTVCCAQVVFSIQRGYTFWQGGSKRAFLTDPLFFQKYPVLASNQEVKSMQEREIACLSGEDLSCPHDRILASFHFLE